MPAPASGLLSGSSLPGLVPGGDRPLTLPTGWQPPQQQQQPDVVPDLVGDQPPQQQPQAQPPNALVPRQLQAEPDWWSRQQITLQELQAAGPYQPKTPQEMGPQYDPRVNRGPQPRFGGPSYNDPRAKQTPTSPLLTQGDVDRGLEWVGGPSGLPNPFLTAPATRDTMDFDPNRSKPDRRMDQGALANDFYNRPENQLTRGDVGAFVAGAMPAPRLLGVGLRGRAAAQTGERLIPEAEALAAGGRALPAEAEALQAGGRAPWEFGRPLVNDTAPLAGVGPYNTTQNFGPNVRNLLYGQQSGVVGAEKTIPLAAEAAPTLGQRALNTGLQTGWQGVKGLTPVGPAYHGAAATGNIGRALVNAARGRFGQSAENVMSAGLHTTRAGAYGLVPGVAGTMYRHITDQNIDYADPKNQVPASLEFDATSLPAFARNVQNRAIFPYRMTYNDARNLGDPLRTHSDQPGWADAGRHYWDLGTGVADLTGNNLPLVGDRLGEFANNARVDGGAGAGINQQHRYDQLGKEYKGVVDEYAPLTRDDGAGLAAAGGGPMIPGVTDTFRQKVSPLRAEAEGLQFDRANPAGRAMANTSYLKGHAVRQLADAQSGDARGDVYDTARARLADQARTLRIPGQPDVEGQLDPFTADPHAFFPSRSDLLAPGRYYGVPATDPRLSGDPVLGAAAAGNKFHKADVDGMARALQLGQQPQGQQPDGVGVWTDRLLAQDRQQPQGQQPLTPEQEAAVKAIQLELTGGVPGPGADDVTANLRGLGTAALVAPEQVNPLFEPGPGPGQAPIPEPPPGVDMPKEQLVQAGNMITSLAQQAGGLEQAKALAAQHPAPKGFEQYWGSLDSTSKLLAIAGLSLAAIGVFKSMFGGDDEEGGSSMLWNILPFLGVGAAAWGLGGGTFSELPKMQTYKDLGSAITTNVGLGDPFAAAPGGQ